MKYFLLLVVLLLPQPILAHALYVVAQQKGTQIEGDAYYSDMTPAKEHYVAVFSVQDPQTPILEKMTDQTGHLRFSVPQEGNYILVVEGEEGHKAKLAVPHLQGQSNVSSDQSAEFQLLRKDIAQLKEKIYWHDILGGIGYIIGIFGLIALMKRKNKE